MDHPTEWPLSADGLCAEFATVGTDEAITQVANPELWKLSGRVYRDVSCFPHVIPEMARAAFGAVQVDDQ